MYTSLASISETLRQFLHNGMLADVGPSGLAAFFAGGPMLVSLHTPQEMATLQQQGLSVWLYRVVRDEARLNDAPIARPLPGGRVEIVPPPLPLRLHYLVTPISDDSPDTEQRILGRVMQLLHSMPILSGAVLRGDLAGTDGEVHTRLEALSLEEIARVWEALEGSYQLSVSYEVSLAYIHSIAEPQSGTPVESGRADWALIVGQEA
jgi:hypothetical protein